jgi:hypothetical protein
MCLYDTRLALLDFDVSRHSVEAREAFLLIMMGMGSGFFLRLDLCICVFNL